MHPEKQYLNLIKYIIKNGSVTKSRNSNTINTIGTMSKYSLKDNTIPILTTKKVAWKTCLKELLWFIRGDTNNELLRQQKVKIWNGNGTRKFLDSRGLYKLKEETISKSLSEDILYSLSLVGFPSLVKQPPSLVKSGLSLCHFKISSQN